MTILRMKAVLFTGVLMTLVLSSTGVNADDYSNAVASAPDALVSNGLMTPGMTGTQNNAKIVTFDASGNVVSETADNADKSIIKITDATNQVGSAWSTANNKFNLNKNNKMSMWMYFGNQGANSGDGMAFVLQNDSRGLSAISGGGESLGVWGVDKGGSESTVAGTAIKNSWALEFDTHKNSEASKGNGFDNLNTIQDNHLASNYPNQRATYEQNGFLSKYNKLAHDGLIAVNLSNGRWWHVTIDYKSTSTTAGSMTYTIGDKVPGTGDVLGGGLAKTVPIDKSKFASTDGQVTWGFTGATGANWETNLVMFEEISDLVSVTATQKVTDTTQNNKDITASGSANSGDKLNLQTTLKYNDGKEDWKKIVASLKTPNAVTLDKEGIIKYADGTTQTFDTTTKDGVITSSLNKNLSKSNDTATISMNGTAKIVATDTKVTSPIGTFNGQNTIVRSQIASFTIKALKQKMTLTGLLDKTIDSGQSIKVTSNVKTDTLMENDNVTITTKLNGEALSDKSMLFNKLGNIDYTEVLPADKLNIGKNTYTVSVDDQYGNSVTGQEIITVNDPGVLKIVSATGALNFGQSDIPIPNEETTYSPLEELSVQVVASVPGTWNLTLTGTDVVGTDGTVLKDALIYKEKATDAGIPLKDHAIDIVGGNSSSNTITKTWVKDTGILLRVKPSEVRSEEYSASAQWNLSNVPTK
ncbi:L-type lectin-domain containing protein [Dellaglioa sp. P0083]|uniref:L-type lectin-domain containing protein n=1 Tax=Dellaglioa kimchii TaxID=3344667 RepID=UPI0038D46985